MSHCHLQLSMLIIALGKFRKPGAAATTTKRETVAEMAANLLRLEGEKIEVVPNTKEGKASVLSDEDLEMLLDRRPEVFADRGKGWTHNTSKVANAESPSTTPNKKTRGAKASARAAFAVYDAPVDEGNDALAKMFGEDINAGDEE